QPRAPTGRADRELLVVEVRQPCDSTIGSELDEIGSREGLFVARRGGPSVPGPVAEHGHIGRRRDRQARKLFKRLTDETRKRRWTPNALGDVWIDVQAVIGPDLSQDPQAALAILVGPRLVIATHSGNQISRHSTPPRSFRAA